MRPPGREVDIEPQNQAAQHWLRRYQALRAYSESLCEPLAVEDYGVQPMADASPPKWHLAHTSWFFDTFLLKPYLPDYRPFHPQFEYLFNSYYNGVSQPFPRSQRGRLSRPTVAEVMDYRAWVDEAMAALLQRDAGRAPELERRLELGLHHEQQHQELIVTDLKFNLGNNPLHPPYRTDLVRTVGSAPPLDFVTFPAGEVQIGATGDGFYFDNEAPRHRVLLPGYALANRLVTNAEYAEFVRAGGYEDARLWLSDGWSWMREAGVTGPLYWREMDQEYLLGGLAPLDREVPVVHVSYYEADAYARWAGCRLPTEQEWEHAAAAQSCHGNFAADQVLHPRVAQGTQGPVDQLYGDVWEWTASPYVPYPGYRPLAGTLGEYNGKFMSNQLVLRGGSCETPDDHVRSSYRNFFYPPDRWQFSGIRLARDL